MRKDAPECEMFFAKYRRIESLQEQFKIRFHSLHIMQPRIDLFTDPLNAAISEQPGEMQLELCELQSDPFFRQGVMRGGLNFGNCYLSPLFPSSEILHS